MADYRNLEGADPQILVLEPFVSLNSSAELLYEPSGSIPVDAWAQVYQFSDGTWMVQDVSTSIIDGRVHTVIGAPRCTRVDFRRSRVLDELQRAELSGHHQRPGRHTTVSASTKSLPGKSERESF